MIKAKVITSGETAFSSHYLKLALLLWHVDVRPTSILRTWPAMRVFSLGIRTVPVLLVAKKLAAPRPTPTAPAAKCELISPRQDEVD